VGRGCRKKDLGGEAKPQESSSARPRLCSEKSLLTLAGPLPMLTKGEKEKQITVAETN
jgi:hypothetical protein